jgi:hypothetical protein
VDQEPKTEPTKPAAPDAAKVSRRKLLALGAVVTPVVVTLPIHGARGNGQILCSPSTFSDHTGSNSCVNGVVVKRR